MKSMRGTELEEKLSNIVPMHNLLETVQKLWLELRVPFQLDCEIVMTFEKLPNKVRFYPHNIR